MAGRLLSRLESAELRGTYSNKRSLRDKYADLQKRIQGAQPRSRLLDSGLRPRQHKRSLGFDDLADINAKCECGASTKQFAGQYGVSNSPKSARLRTHGLTLRHQGLTDDKVIEAANFYTAGRSLAWLAVRYRVSPINVSRALSSPRCDAPSASRFIARACASEYQQLQ